MNPCVFTGVMFVDEGTGQRHTGDLFFDPLTGWQIRGVPYHCGMPVHTGDARQTHIRIAGATYAPRSSHYADTDEGIAIVACGEHFRAHIRKWYPELVGALGAMVPL